MNAAVAATLAGYLAAAGLFLGYLYGLRDALARAARYALWAGVVLQLVAIGIQCVTTGISPVRNLSEALSFFAWVTALGYLLVSTRYRIAVGGAFVAPIVLGLYAMGRLGHYRQAVGGATGAHGSTALLTTHIVFSMLGVAALAVAASVALLYLWQERNLKQKRGGALAHRIPPLGTLDSINYRCLVVGFPVYTAAVITGLVGVARHLGPWFSASHAMAVGIWVCYAALLALRTAAGWGGRRGAVGTLIGFGGALLVMLAYALRGTLGGGAL
jgi:ABC-type uncharacterized transport system permease subunit